MQHVTKQELKEHIADQLCDNLKAKPLGSPGNAPPPTEPSTKFDMSTPRWADVKQVVEPQHQLLGQTVCHIRYLNTALGQKAGVPGFLGLVEYSAVIWEQIQTAKRRQEDLQVWLYLANAFSSVAHQLITYNFSFFHVHHLSRIY